MSTQSSLKSCSTCSPGAKDTDCASCKLDFLKETKKKKKKSMAHVNDIEEDDYSLSEQITKKGNDFSILYLVIAAVFIFALVLLFSKFLVAK